MNNEQLYYDTLKKIAKGYMTPEQIRREDGQAGLSYHETLEMAYENIQQDAANAIFRKRRPKESASHAK